MASNPRFFMTPGAKAPGLWDLPLSGAQYGLPRSRYATSEALVPSPSSRKRMQLPDNISDGKYVYSRKNH